MVMNREMLKLAGLRGDELEAALFQQASILGDERSLEQGFTYSDEQIGQSVVHTRQDLVLLIGYTKLAGKRLRHIRFMMLVMMLCALAVTYKFYEPEIAAILVRLGLFGPAP